MAHEQDYWEGFRGWLIPKLGLIPQLLEDITGERFYVESETHNSQFVGRVPMDEESFEQELHEMGFHRNPLASWKHLGTNPEEDEEASFRKIGYENHPKMQLHVVLYDGSKIQNADTDHMYVYAHWELRWDVYPWKHYRGHQQSAEEGVKRMKDLLDQNGITYELVRP